MLRSPLCEFFREFLPYLKFLVFFLLANLLADLDSDIGAMFLRLVPALLMGHLFTFLLGLLVALLVGFLSARLVGNLLAAFMGHLYRIHEVQCCTFDGAPPRKL